MYINFSVVFLSFCIYIPVKSIKNTTSVFWQLPKQPKEKKCEGFSLTSSSLINVTDYDLGWD